MSCCGRQQQPFMGIPAVSQPPSPIPTHHPQGAAASHPPLFFEYVGRTGLTVIGPITGRRYRFDQRGSRVAVDPADEPSMAAVPQLRQVAGR
jgi:hypothetical protein